MTVGIYAAVASAVACADIAITDVYGDLHRAHSGQCSVVAGTQQTKLSKCTQHGIRLRDGNNIFRFTISKLLPSQI
eukprot:2080655-Pleurochrysis_carterae.AAC.1